jgi:hypothetical protein
VFTIAIVAPLIWLAWLVLIDWVPMFPLNDLRPDNRRHRVVAGSINYPFPLLIVAGVALHHTWSQAVALVLCGLILYGHVTSWWLPYFGISTAAQRATYLRDYARTRKLLPVEGHAVVIDVQHMVVGVLSLIMAGTTLFVTLGAT